MSDTQDAAAQEAPEAPEQKNESTTNEDTFDVERAKQKIAKANAEAKGLRERLREIEAKAAKFDELEAAKKTEVERLSEERERLMFELNEVQSSLLRERVGRRHGLPDDLVDRIKGKDEEEMDADAKALASLLPQKIQRFSDPAMGEQPLALNGDGIERALRRKLGV